MDRAMFLFCWDFDFLCIITNWYFHCILSIFSTIKFMIQDLNWLIGINSCKSSSKTYIHINIRSNNNIQMKKIVRYDILKIMIHLAWVANSMVIFSASYVLTGEFIQLHYIGLYGNQYYSPNLWSRPVLDQGCAPSFVWDSRKIVTRKCFWLVSTCSVFCKRVWKVFHVWEADEIEN